MGPCSDSQEKVFGETIWFWLPQTPLKAPPQHQSARTEKTFLKTAGHSAMMNPCPWFPAQPLPGSTRTRLGAGGMPDELSPYAYT